MDLNKSRIYPEERKRLVLLVGTLVGGIILTTFAMLFSSEIKQALNNSSQLSSELAVKTSEIGRTNGVSTKSE